MGGGGERYLDLSVEVYTLNAMDDSGVTLKMASNKNKARRGSGQPFASSYLFGIVLKALDSFIACSEQALCLSNVDLLFARPVPAAFWPRYLAMPNQAGTTLSAIAGGGGHI